MILAKAMLRPPQGFFFINYDGVTIKGKSWLEVERKVITYRRINHFPRGEPMREIMEQGKARNPEFFWEKTIRGE